MGVKIKILKPSIYLQSKYLPGITNIDEGDSTETIWSRGLALMVGISFPTSN